MRAAAALPQSSLPGRGTAPLNGSEQQGNQDGHQARNPDRDSTHRALKLAQLDRLAGADRMAACPDCDPLRHRIFDPEQPDHKRGKHCPGHPCNQHCQDGDRPDATPPCRNFEGDRGGNRLGQERGEDHLIKAEQTAEQRNTCQRGSRSRKTPHHDRQEILAQHLSLVVDREGESCGRRADQHIDDFAANVKLFERDAEGQQNHRTKQDRDKQRVCDRGAQPLVDPCTDPEGHHTQHDPEQRAGYKLINHPDAPFCRQAASAGKRPSRSHQRSAGCLPDRLLESGYRCPAECRGSQ